MKVILEYIEEEGQVRDANGSNIGVLYGLKAFPPEELESAVPVKDVVALKEAGFCAEEIIEMHKKGVL